MTSVEERLAYLEGQMQEQSHGFPELRGSISEVRSSIAQLDARLSGSIAQLDAKTSESIARLDDKMTRGFVWLVGISVTVLTAVIAGLFSR